ncbi:ABC-type branched-chain amino acid transport system, substrate-binding protein [Amycolatopsis arida]|uniref:ABC-type branched-chain amino acid transport system, substrate-binding protein n=1 Tax=Amycolatopsis arida TaxID=587909 RepID=A0A1I5SBP1_9PSEU|nr:ABC transporter substrate-binding protein [Amycolatopsis arida]TDX96532.1 ABC-type branched-subunit amino acid transport system substrate-binding protein [Amycolatopsis arida]SFP68131.1 ABC-type branched-chain amino acid transport system, substrate-binding protein [Amycolatopsis arida]
MKRLVAVAFATALALTACGTKGGDSGSSGTDESGVKTGVGVTDADITLGVMTDKTGVFKNLGLGITQGNELWVDDVNAAGGICGRQVRLEQVDHGYKADTAKTLYPQIEPKVLGFVQLLGSPITAALKQNLASDKAVAAPASWSSELLDNPYLMIVGTTYDVEMIDGLSYLQEQGMIADGDTVGHIYIDGEYGANGLRGAKYYAEQHDLDLREVKITSTDNDLTNIVTGFKGDGVKAILLTTSPTQTGSVLAANKALGLDVPVLGNNPVFDPVLHSSPAADALDKLYVVASSVPFSADIPKAQEVARKYQARYTEPPNAGVPYGYAVAEVWGAVLRRACENKDLTREGVHAAFQRTSSVDTGDLVAELDFSQPGAPATRKVYVAQPDAAAEGGLKYVKPLFEAPDAKDYQAPHQK